MRFLEVVVALAIRDFKYRRSKLTWRERRKINYRTRMYLFMKASRVVLHGVRLRGSTTLNFPKWEHFTFLACPLRFLVISAMKRLWNVRSFKKYMFRKRDQDRIRNYMDRLVTPLGGQPPHLPGVPHLLVNRPQICSIPSWEVYTWGLFLISSIPSWVVYTWGLIFNLVYNLLGSIYLRGYF